MSNCFHCNGPLDGLDFASSHFNRERCFRILKMRIADLSREASTASNQRDTAFRRAEEAEVQATRIQSALDTQQELHHEYRRRSEELESEIEATRKAKVGTDAIAKLAFCEALRLLDTAHTPRPRDAWKDDDGPVLWWKLPVCEPPYAGTPLDDDFPDYVTHWTPIVVPVEGGSDV